MPTLSVVVVGISAGFVALVLLWPRVRSGPPAGRMAGEVFVVTLALSALAYGLLIVGQRLPW